MIFGSFYSFFNKIGIFDSIVCVKTGKNYKQKTTKNKKTIDKPGVLYYNVKGKAETFFVFAKNQADGNRPRGRKLWRIFTLKKLKSHRE